MEIQNGTHAVVIGGSMAGMLAARVLSDHFDHVTIIERDELTNTDDYRRGVPQARHLHTLLARGQNILEDFFPGITRQMVDYGAPEASWGENVYSYTVGGWIPVKDYGVYTNTIGRTGIEMLVRRRIGDINNITTRSQQEVTRLLCDGDTITGVEIQSRRDKSTNTLTADLIVDASGRRSNAPGWLQDLGYDAPEETIIDAHTGYATRWYEIPADLELVALLVQARPGEGLYRGGAFLCSDDQHMVVTLLGANGDYPPTDEADFIAFAKSLPTTQLYEIIKDAKPVSQIYGYRGLRNQMRHYEKLNRRPENFLITGDAAIAFNPIYGQGMSSAAMEAEVLHQLLRETDRHDYTGLAARFQKAIVVETAGAWLVSTSEDMRYPDVEGAKPSLQDRFAHRYFDLVAQAMPHDKVVTGKFIEVLNILQSPMALFRPDIVVRVLAANLLHRNKPVPQPPRLKPQLQTGQS